MSEYVEVVEETETHRVILVQDTDCESPIEAGDAWVTSALVRHGRHYEDSSWEPMLDPGDRYEALRYFERSEATWSDHEHAFKRYMRIFHGIEVFDVTIHNGYRDTSSALAWVEPSEAERVGANLREGGRIVVRQEVDEYNRWADGETYGYVVQERVIEETTISALSGEILADRRVETWRDTDESCFGFIGYEYAEQEAREALKAVAGEPWCNHDAVAVVNGVCECGERVSPSDNDKEN